MSSEIWKDRTKAHEQTPVESIKGSRQRRRESAKDAERRASPILEKIRHILPVFDDKQLATISPANGGAPGRAGSIGIDDIYFHARLLSGALGVDLSMLGFADQMSGGLGEGGFFRMSAQAAERSRVIRVALEECFNSIIDVHTYQKYGMVFTPSERPWDINFYGSISALEAEKQRTKADAMNAAGLIAQIIGTLKECGATPEIAERFLQKEMMIDEDEAKLYAQMLKAPAGGEGGEMGGGFEGGEQFEPKPKAGGEEGAKGDAPAEGEEPPEKPKKKAFGRVGGSAPKQPAEG